MPTPRNNKLMQLLSAKRGPKRDDPTLAEAVDAYLDLYRAEQKASSLKSMVSASRAASKPRRSRQERRSRAPTSER